MSQPAVVPTPERNLVGAVPPPPGPRADVEGGAAKKAGCDKLKALALGLRAAALLFSFISFIIMATVDYFTYVGAACYVFAIALIVFVYTTVFVGIHGHELHTGEVVIPQKVAVWMNFFGDQILALLLLSAGSAGAEALSVIDLLIGGVNGIPIVDKATASIAMAFLAFIALEPAALISTYNFSVYLSKSSQS